MELNLPPDAVNSLRGELLNGNLVRVEEVGEDEREFVVHLDGEDIRFVPVDDSDATGAPPAGKRWCRQVLLDFREVGVEVLDGHTLRITLKSPTPYFLSLMGFYPLYPVNRECVEKYGSPDWTYPGNLVGNGPFTMQLRRIRDRNPACAERDLLEPRRGEARRDRRAGDRQHHHGLEPLHDGQRRLDHRRAAPGIARIDPRRSAP